jgi:hypothetical protein
MRTKLQDQLAANDEVDFIELKKSIEIADWVRSIKRRYKLSNDDLVEYLSLKKGSKEVLEVLGGYHKYDVLTIARIEAMLITLKANESQLDDVDVDS